MILLTIIFTTGILLRGYEIAIAIQTVAYPMYCSVMAMEDGKTTSTNKWLTYWAMYTLFTYIETWFIWVPYHWLIRWMFFSFLMMPQFQGASLIYEKALKPLVIEYQHDAEELIDSIN